MGGNARWESRSWKTKIVQPAVVTVLNRICEEDFPGVLVRFPAGAQRA